MSNKQALGFEGTEKLICFDNGILCGVKISHSCTDAELINGTQGKMVSIVLN